MVPGQINRLQTEWVTRSKGLQTETLKAIYKWAIPQIGYKNISSNIITLQYFVNKDLLQVQRNQMAIYIIISIWPNCYLQKNISLDMF